MEKLEYRAQIFCHNIGCSTASLGILSIVAPRPLFNMFFVWMAVVMAGNLIKLVYATVCRLRGIRAAASWLDRGLKRTPFQAPFGYLGNFPNIRFYYIYASFFQVRIQSRSAEANESWIPQKIW